MKKRYKVVVAHPNRQHSFRLATALKKYGYLEKYITTVYYKENNLTSKLKRLAGAKYSNKINQKKCEFLDENDVIQFCELEGLIFLILIRIPILKKIYRKFGAYLNHKFGIKVAKEAIKLGADIVVMYDTTADACFDFLKKEAPEILCILDMSSNVSVDRVKIYEDQMNKINNNNLKKENKYLWSKDYEQRNINELYNSDYFLVPSSFSENSILKQGINKNKIFINPYGVDIEKFKEIKKDSIDDDILRLVYSGGVTYGKGIDYLLDVISELKDYSLDITLFGQYDVNGDIYMKYKHMKNIHFKGFVSQDDLITTYSKSDIFVFPSLGEGLSLAALEAMSCGLPIICSDNSGVNDLITNYQNGIVFEAGNTDELKSALTWIYNNKNKLNDLSECARKTVCTYTWDNYYRNINKIIREVMKGR